MPAHGASHDQIIRERTRRTTQQIQSNSRTRFLGSGSIQEGKARLGYEETIVSNEATLKPNQQQMQFGALQASKGKKQFSNNSSQVTNLMRTSQQRSGAIEGIPKKKSL